MVREQERNSDRDPEIERDRGTEERKRDPETEMREK